MKIFILFFIFLNFTSANEISIVDKFYIDKNNTLTIKDILKNKNQFQTITKYNQGNTNKNIWIQLSIKNNSKKDLIKRIYNKRAGLDFVDIYILKDDKIVKTYTLGDMVEYKDRDNIFRIGYFDLNIKASQTIDIFIKQKSYSAMDLRWNIKDIDSFKDYYSSQAVIYAVITGMFTVTIIVSLMLFFFLQNKFYLIYSTFTFVTIIYQYAVAGFFYQIEAPLYLITILNFPFPILILIVLALFPFFFFDIKKNEFKIIIIILKALLFILLAFSILEFFFPLNYNILYLSKYTTPLGFLTILTMLFLSIKIFIAKKRSSLFYMLSNLVQFFFISFYILSISGVVSYSNFYYYTLSIGVIAQDILLGLALVHATYLIKKDSDKKTELLNEYSKISFIGQTMVNISHQWKTPINAIYNSINHIEIAQEFGDGDIKNIINKNIKNIKQNTIYLKDTALTQLNFYKEKKNLEETVIYEEIGYVINLIESEFSKKSININLICDKDLIIKIEKNYFLNILMILFENSFKIFDKRNIKEPSISVKVTNHNNTFQLEYKDNGGGVSKELLPKLFDKNFSLENSTGVGLYLAKEIVLHKLEGTIHAKNTESGLCFMLKI